MTTPVGPESVISNLKFTLIMHTQTNRASLWLLLPVLVLALSPCARADDAANPPIKPLGNDGKPLNLDLEDGTLKDWTATGDAFEGQPVRGDTVNKRRSSDRSGHQGEFWIGGYEVKAMPAADNATGTLTSVPFKASHRWASFLVGGGHWPETRVELSIAGETAPFFKVSGHDREEMQPVVIDLEKQSGKEIFIRIVDEKKGPWGH